MEEDKIKEFLEVASRDNFYSECFSDILGLAKKAFPEMWERDFSGKNEALRKILEYIVSYEQMWHDIGNQDPHKQLIEYKSKKPLFLDPSHKIKNFNLDWSDYLFTFKEFMKRWAARKNTGSPVNDWYKMQDEFSEKISEYWRYYRIRDM